MTDIFKPRKTPKHLIIEEHHAFRRRPRNMLKWVLWFVGLLLVTGLALEFHFLNGT